MNVLIWVGALMVVCSVLMLFFAVLTVVLDAVKDRVRVDQSFSSASRRDAYRQAQQDLKGRVQ